MITPDAKIFIAGHRGLVGSALVQELKNQGFHNLILKTRSELDLLDTVLVADFFATEKPDYVFLAAAKVGGILANDTYPAEFIYENLQIQNNIIHHSYLNQVTRLLFLGSSCIYPKLCPQPMREDYLLTDTLEKTNEAYAIAKIAGLKLCEYYKKQYDFDALSVMPTNLYGPNDHFDLHTSHVLPAMIRKFHEAKIVGHSPVTLWGTGTPMREFLHVEDLARACLFLMQQPVNKIIHSLYNIGVGKDITIKELATLIQRIVGHTGELIWDSSKPDGTPKKLLDINRIQTLGWQAEISLKDGVQKTYEWYLQSLIKS
ncbi:uncharacterized protein LOC132564848 [Ylistrum balloti]|uniref:uncharacterized protein LOC132564848 n=1 Tax=Ylistrum balloti TaxID=509963 RepID=UPI0029058BEC|nr:uncharacterized protein LOC132564848 [Ylistrum balloti]